MHRVHDTPPSHPKHGPRLQVGSTSHRASLLASALHYAERGMYVHPLLVGGKEPRWDGWEARATRDPALIERTWSRAPFNVGVACGPSGLVVVDLDLPHDGEVSAEAGVIDGMTMLRALAARTPGARITPTLTVVTASGGRHLVYRAPAGSALRNSARRLGFCIDTRAAGGYVVGIGSVINGRRYSLEGSITEPAVLPGWLLTLLSAAPEPPKAGRAPRRAEVVARLRELTRQGTREQRWAYGVLRSECDDLAAAREGGRNDRLNLAAYRAGQLVGAGLLDQALAEQTLTDAATACGLGDGSVAEVAKTLASGMAAGMARPRRMGAVALRRTGGAA